MYSDFIDSVKYMEQKEKEIKEKREKWDKSIMNTLHEFEKHSHCAAKHVCCILVQEDKYHNYNILSIGINGTAPGQPNCDEVWKRYEPGWINKKDKLVYPKEAHHIWSNINEIHAEVNAISKCAKSGIPTDGAYAFISYSPCMHCAKLLVSSGFKRVCFRERYDDYEEIKKFLNTNGVEVIQYF